VLVGGIVLLTVVLGLGLFAAGRRVDRQPQPPHDR
jgi:hypothetical protein